MRSRKNDKFLINFLPLYPPGSDVQPWGTGAGLGAAVFILMEKGGAFEDTITLSEARSRLDQRRFSRPKKHFAAFFKIFKKFIFSQADLQNFAKFL